MKNKLILISLLQLSISLSNAQIGLIKSAGEKVTPKNNSNSTPFDSEFINRYWLAYRSISGYGKSGVERMKYRNSIDVDSAKLCYNEMKSNPKKYSSNYSFVEEYEKFDANIEFSTFKSIEEKSKVEYSKYSTLNQDIINEINNNVLIIEAVKDIFSDKARLNQLNELLNSQKKRYASQLVTNGLIGCEEQLNCFNQFYFSDNKLDPNCQKGKTNIRIDSPNNGIAIHFFTDKFNTFKGNTSIFLKGKEIVSISTIDNNKTPQVKGWFSELLLPGLKNIDAQSYYRIETLVKSGLKSGDTIYFENKALGSRNYLIFSLNGYSGTLENFMKDLKNAYLLSQKPEVPTYKNPTLEKEAIAALEKYQSLNPKEKFGTTVKCIIAGDYWETKKDYNGNPKYQQTNAYFYVKGSDGEYYIVRHTITKDYDIKTKKYGPIKISGFAEKKITHSSYFN